MSVKLHLTSGEEYLVPQVDTEAVLDLMRQHSIDSGYLTFTSEQGKDTIIIRHIVKISEI